MNCYKCNTALRDGEFRWFYSSDENGAPVELKVCVSCDSGTSSNEQTNTEDIDQIRSISLSTLSNLPGNRDYSVVGVVTAECVFGMNIFRDIFAAVRDVVGGRSDASEKVLKDLKATCLTELKEEAYKVGADAVLGIDLDYSEFSGGGKSMLFLVASGTAVKIIEDAEDQGSRPS